MGTKSRYSDPCKPPLALPALRTLLALTAISTSLLITACGHNRQRVEPAPVEKVDNEVTDNVLESQPYTNEPITAEPLEAGSAAFKAEQLLTRSRNALDIEKPALQLQAAEYFFIADDQRTAISIINNIDTRYLSPLEQNLHRLFVAKGMVFNNRNNAALTQLGNIDFEQLPGQYRAELFLVQAQAELALANKGAALEALIQRENHLDRESLSANQQLLWDVIDTMTEIEIANVRNTSNNASLLQWLELITLADNARNSNGNTSYDQDSFNSSITSDIPSTWNSLSPRKIALLLPLNSQFGTAAKAFEQGFRQAKNSLAGNSRPSITTYDISDDSHYIDTIIDQAIAEGADFIVGPLGKVAAQNTLDYAQTSIPMLVLGGDIKYPSPLINVFTLSPEQEINAMAQHAYSAGYRQAGILFPDSIWGDRLNTAFADAWSRLGGNIVAQDSYQPDQYDHGDTIKQLLGINLSQNRYSRLSATLGFKPEYTPARRTDMDFLFLAARTNSARVIKPQLSFHQAHNLPVYATSHVYSGYPDPINDADLDSIIFPDMPWLLNPETEKNLGGLNARLFAFGHDAFNLIPILPQLRNSDGLSYSGLSGKLVANSNGEIIRHPSWAQFRDGKVEALVPVLETDEVSVSTSNTQGVSRNSLVGSAKNTSSTPVITGSKRYDPQNWDKRTNRRKVSP
ncbi:MAG: penicillin-binding protein activator [Arenicella sp.]